MRSLRRSPGFTAAAVFTLALGVGGNVALYSVVQAILLRPLPFPDPHRLVFVSSTVNREAGVPVSPPDFIDWRQQGRCFESLAAVFDGRPVNLTGTSEPERLIAARVSADFFSVMRVPALHGRTFSREEDRPGASPVVVLSYGLWQRRFGSDPGVVGKTVVLDGRGHTVVGVMPPQFCYPAGQDAWLPLAVEGIEGWGRRAHVLDVAGRLRQGITVEQADSEMRALAGRIAREHPQTNTGWGAHVVPLDERIVGNTKTALFVLLAAVGLLLLIACANVANLLLARASARIREMAVRAALGAGRGRLVRLLLAECLVLAFLAAAAGLVLGFATLGLARPAMAAALPRVDEIAIDRSVLAFTAPLAALTCLLFGLTPAWQVSRTAAVEAIRNAGRIVQSRRNGVLRNGLVMAQVALSFVLLIGAGLMFTTVVRLERVNTGFDPDGILTLRTSWFPPAGLRDSNEQAARLAAFYDAVLLRLRNLPGVEAAATATLPLSGGDPYLPFRIEGDLPVPKGEEQRVDQQRCTTDYFRAMRIPVLRGRVFESRDGFGNAAVAVIDDAFARRFLPGRDPLGDRILFDDGGGPRTIVGIVGNVRHRSLATPATPEVYLHQAQWPSSGMTLVVRTAVDPARLTPAIREAVRAADPTIPVSAVRTMQQVLAGTIADRRFMTLLLGAFGGVALLLAAVGLYGVVAYLVARRTPEIGVRMALGAERKDVVRLVVRHALFVTVLGTALGAGLALVFTRFLATLLYEVRPTDPMVFAAIAALLLAVAWGACRIPARRAAKVDPVIALRLE